MPFTVNSNTASELLSKLLGNITGLSQFEINLTGDRRAFGIFQDDPFNLGAGIVISTGKVADLVGKNTSDGGLSPAGRSIPISFTRLSGLAGNTQPGNFGTAVFRADLSNLGFDLKSISIADSGEGEGAPGLFTGFDLDGIKLSRTLVNDAAAVEALPGLAVFDFSPAGTSLATGSQTAPVDPTQPDLYGTLQGNLNNAVATLEKFDSTGVANSTSRSVSLGNGGRIGFNLTEAVAQGQPLYLYIGEGGGNETAPSGEIAVSNRLINELNDLSTDFGLPGEANDEIKLQIDFDADSQTEKLYLRYIFGSEEFLEYGGRINDEFQIELNGISLAQLSDGKAVTINNLVPDPLSEAYHPDFINNTVAEARAETRLDGYTKPLIFAGDLNPNSRNTLTITVKDRQNGLLDTATFIQAGSLSTVDPNDPGQPGPGRPSNNGGIVTLPGTSTQSTNLLLTLVGSSADAINEVGLFKINDARGGLDLDNDGQSDLFPGDRDYTQAALEQGKVIFSALAKGGIPDATRILTGFKGGDRLAFYLVQDSSTDQVLRGITPTSRVLFGSTFGQGDSRQLRISEANDSLTLQWEDLTINSDQDFNDLVMTLKTTDQAPPAATRRQGLPQGELLDLRGIDLNRDGATDTLVRASFVVNSEAANDNFVGFYRVDNSNGLVDGLLPGDPGYAAAAVRRTVTSFDRKGNNSVLLNQKDLGLLAPYIIANGSPEQFLRRNPSNSPNLTPNIYFNFLGANPNKADHIRLLGDNVFGFEDSSRRSEFDFNDMVVQVRLSPTG